MDHSKHIRLSDIEITERNLKGATVFGQNDEKVGTVAHMHGVGNTGRVVIEVGGFLGFGAKSVAVAASELDIMRDESGSIHAVTNWTKDQLKDMPEHKD